MSWSGVARVVLVGLLVGLIAGVGEASGVAPAWAVLIGVTVAALGAPPVVHRGATAVGGGVVAVLVLRALDGLGAAPSLAMAATAGVVVVAAGLLRLRADIRMPAWAVLAGGAAVLAAATVADGTTFADLAPGLAGLVAGLLPLQVGEILAQLRLARREAERREQATVVIDAEADR